MAAPTNAHIDSPFPPAEPLTLRIAVGACRLRVAPGAGEPWLAGTYDGGAGAIPHTLELKDGTLRLSQRVELLRTLDLLSGGAPSFDLSLGTARSYALELDCGAVDASIDLGGLPLTRLVIRQGAGRLRVDFSAPARASLSELRVDAGATSLEMARLANAGFADMHLAGGAAKIDLDFGGALSRDCQARMDVGMAALRLAVPGTTAARIDARAIVGALRIGDGFTKRAGAFWTEGAVAGKTPVLSIRAETSVGLLELAAT
jgi:hypothetical protein